MFRLPSELVQNDEVGGPHSKRYIAFY